MPRVLAALAMVAAALLVTTSLHAAPRTPAAPAPPRPTQAVCGWNAPGHNPFMGDVVAAVDAYQDIPVDTRARLQQRMASRAYDEVVRIRRDSIEGQRAYRSEIHDMHFGNGQRCATVDRSAWPAQAEERGLVYCEAGHCILVPTVCRNVSRIQIASAGGGGVAAAPGQPAVDGALAAAAPMPEPGTALALSIPAAAADTSALPLSQVVGAAAPGANGDGVGLVGWGAGLPGMLATPDGALATPRLDGPDRWLPDPLVPNLLRPPLGLAPPLAVPEPATSLLMPAGLLLVLAACRRRFSRA